ncbi:hypothetical protein L1267_12170 [Pseudoalteromonas sp. OFAV1]|jgi:hypothetical protein|uniref:hypothetical protein n=1 Tax=Pseudoalteromonas sp. OFAV1 TaxID=2908892 RepID=UPI001F412B9E|nr:hypothetical protein [Pseudoalteromonas sp. OFAV1]MCF2901147.1 hypothetical protein [Pseudoalteromonas sp. OFAV1]
MYINILGLDNRTTGATLLARKGLKIGNDQVVSEVTKKSVTITNECSELSFKVSELNVPYWLIDKEYREFIKKDGGKTNFYPTEVEKALAAILDADSLSQKMCVGTLNNLIQT